MSCIVGIYNASSEKEKPAEKPNRLKLQSNDLNRMKFTGFTSPVKLVSQFFSQPR